MYYVFGYRLTWTYNCTTGDGIASYRDEMAMNRPKYSLPLLALLLLLDGCPGNGSGGSGGGGSSFAIATTTAPFGIVGNNYSTTLASTGGVAPFTWTLFGGALPAGLNLTSPATGAITGNPTTAGNSTATFMVTDSTGATATGPVFFAVHPRTDLLSVDNNAPPVPGNGLSSAPSISNDGRFVAFVSLASNLSSGGVGSQVYVHDWQTNRTTLISRNGTVSSPTGGNGPSSAPTISGDGQFIAFVSSATNLLPAGSPSVTGSQIYRFDLQLGLTSLVSRDNSGNPFSGGATMASPAISDNGQFIAFVSDAVNLGASGQQVYLHDTQVSGPFPNGQTILVSKDNSNPSVAGNGNSATPSISGDGCFVAFGSASTNLGAPANQVLGRGPLAIAGCGGIEQTFLVSRDSAGNPASAGSTNTKPSVSGNGQFVAFRTTATNFGATGTQIYLRDTLGNQTILVSKDNSVPSLAGDNPSDSPSISNDGCLVAFASAAANFGAAANQIYVRGPLAAAGCAGVEQTSLVSRDDAGNPANSAAGTTIDPSTNGNGQFVAFSSSATNLVAPPPGNSQIYVRALP